MANLRRQVITSNGVPISITVLANSLLVVKASWYQNTHVLTGFTGATLVHAANCLRQNGDFNTDIFYILNTSAGALTLTPTWTGGAPSAFGFHTTEFTLGGETATFNVGGNNGGGPVLVTTLNLAGVAAGDIIDTIVNQSALSSGMIVPPGFETPSTHTGFAYYDDSSDRLGGAGGTIDCHFDFNSNFGSYAQSAAAFSVTGSTPPAKPANYYQQMMG